ncbi:hypothetical protein AVEN_37030-1 [Araneus ventricosus]|uniref:Uncharacterized protein n=1 Tax=Araneus ventricosus TaxID=182803 RepID=A0A4Y2EN76_ARAVE|nr:hypothetical protein AVEN_37030-1 [Araneus ventricosus]
MLNPTGANRELTMAQEYEVSECPLCSLKAYRQFNNFNSLKRLIHRDTKFNFLFSCRSIFATDRIYSFSTSSPPSSSHDAHRRALIAGLQFNGRLRAGITIIGKWKSITSKRTLVDFNRK